jgi:hypothetical protein
MEHSYYTLVGEYGLRYWVVCHSVDSSIPSFEKVSVLELLDINKKWFSSPPSGFIEDAKSAFV